MQSDLLGEGVNYSVYLPPGYEQSSRRYPVVYLLHGFSDNETAWVQFGEVQLTADQAIANREMPPMVIVMPDAGVTWYIDDAQGQKPYEQMFFEEFLPHIEENYQVRTEKEFRGVAGLSMGGYGSLVWAMHRPDRFAAVAALSSGVMTEEEIVQMEDTQYSRFFSNLYGQGLRGEERITEHFQHNSPLYLARTLPAEELRSVRWYIDCGDDDFLYQGNSALHVALRKREVPHEYRVRDGAHNWTYWRTHIRQGLRFIGKSFHR